MGRYNLAGSATVYGTLEHVGVVRVDACSHVDVFTPEEVDLPSNPCPKGVQIPRTVQS